MRALPLLLTTLVVAAGSVWANDQRSREYEIKAAFVYNVLKFVEWPAATATGPLHVTLVTAGGLPEFPAALNGKSVKGRTVVVQAAKSLEALGTPAPAVVFVASDAAPQLRRALKAADGHPVLTIAENDNEAAADAVIAMAVNQTKLAFEVNLDAAGRAGLRLNSNLLALARSVKGAPTVVK